MGNIFDGFTVLIKLKQSDNFYSHIKGNYSKETDYTAKDVYFGTNLFNNINLDIQNKIITEEPELYIIVNPEGNENSYFPTEFYKAEHIKNIIFRNKSPKLFEEAIQKLPDYYRKEMKVDEGSIYNNIIKLENVKVIQELEFFKSLSNKKYLNKKDKLFTEEKINDFLTKHANLVYLINSWNLFKLYWEKFIIEIFLSKK